MPIAARILRIGGGDHVAHDTPGPTGGCQSPGSSPSGTPTKLRSRKRLDFPRMPRTTSCSRRPHEFGCSSRRRSSGLAAVVPRMWDGAFHADRRGVCSLACRCPCTLTGGRRQSSQRYAGQSKRRLGSAQPRSTPVPESRIVVAAQCRARRGCREPAGTLRDSCARRAWCGGCARRRDGAPCVRSSLGSRSVMIHRALPASRRAHGVR